MSEFPDYSIENDLNHIIINLKLDENNTDLALMLKLNLAKFWILKQIEKWYIV